MKFHPKTDAEGSCRSHPLTQHTCLAHFAAQKKEDETKQATHTVTVDMSEVVTNICHYRSFHSVLIPYISHRYIYSASQSASHIPI